MGMVPAQLHALCRCPLISEIRPNQMKMTFIVGDIVNADIIRKCHDAFKADWDGPAFGMTEGIGTFGWDGSEDLVTTHGGMVGLGRPLPGTRVRICAAEDGTILKKGDQGEMQLSCPPMPTHYLENHNPEAFCEDDQGRWFKTGDLAMIDNNGVVFVLGLIKDSIKYKGISLGPAVFEGCLNRLPGIEVSNVCTLFTT